MQGPVREQNPRAVLGNRMAAKNDIPLLFATALSLYHESESLNSIGAFGKPPINGAGSGNAHRRCQQQAEYGDFSQDTGYLLHDLGPPVMHNIC